MAKTKEEIQEIIDEIAELCRQRGVWLVGTAAGASGYGEIAVMDDEAVLELPKGPVSRDYIRNFIYEVEQGGKHFVSELIG